MAEDNGLIGIVIATHRGVGEEMLAAARGIVGEVPTCVALQVHYGHSLDEAREALSEAIDGVNAGSGVIVFTDMFGGTPTNIALSLMGEKKIEVVAGVSLPMLIKAHSARKTMPLGELACFIKEYGTKNIIVAGDLFRCTLKEKN